MSKQEKLPAEVVDDWNAHMDELLNEALMQTFPCSDPIAISITKSPPTDRQSTPTNEAKEATRPTAISSEKDHE